MGNIKILKASAGSGKTYQLAYAYIRNVIRDPGRYRHILAVTFTNKATEEMKQRIISEINPPGLRRAGRIPACELVRPGTAPDTIRRRAGKRAPEYCTITAISPSSRSINFSSASSVRSSKSWASTSTSTSNCKPIRCSIRPPTV